MAETMISPGVYTQIMDLSTYLNSTPGTIGFVPILTDRGPDNVLTRVTSFEDYIQKFGEPDIRTFGKYYGCGPYIASQHLGVSNDLYVVRALPDDATYAHTFIYFGTEANFPLDYWFDSKYWDKVDIDDTTKYNGTHAALKAFNIEPGTPYGEQSDIPVYAQNTREDNAYLVDAEQKSAALTAEALYTRYGYKITSQDDIDEGYFTTDTQFAKKFWKIYLKNEKNEDGTINKENHDWNIERKIACANDGAAYDSNFLAVSASTSDSAKGILSVYTDMLKYAYSNEADKIEDTDFYYIDSAKKEAAYDAGAAFRNAGSKGYILVSNTEGSFFSWGREDFSGSTAETFYIDENALTQATSDDTESTVDPDAPDAGDDTPVTPTNDEPSYRLATPEEIANPEIEKFVDLYKSFEDAAELITATNDEEFARLIGQEDEHEEFYKEEKVNVPLYSLVEDTAYMADEEKTETAFAAGCLYIFTEAKDGKNYGTKVIELSAVPTGSILYVTNPYFAQMQDGEPVVAENTVLKMPSVDKTENVFVLDPDMIHLAHLNNAVFDKNGNLRDTEDPEIAVLTTIEEYAKTKKAPKMSSTQMLDSMFYGNDTLIKASVDTEVYKGANNQYAPHNCVIAYVRAIGRGDYYNKYSIKITSDANPQNFGTYKFQIYELQDGIDVLCESYNVSFDPEALDGDGESMYFADVINRFSTRVVVEANNEAVAVCKEEMMSFYKNDPTIVNITEDYIVGDGFPQVPYLDTDELSSTYGKVVETTNPMQRKTLLGYKGIIVYEAYRNKAYAEKAQRDASIAYEAALSLKDGAEKNKAIEEAIDLLNEAQDMAKTAEEIFAWATSRNLMNMADSDELASGEQPFYLDMGSLGSLITDKGIVNPKIGDQILCYAYTGLLKNPVTVKKEDTNGNIMYITQYTDNVYDLDWIYFSIVYDPGYKPNVKNAAKTLVEVYRRDCVLISDCGDNARYEDCLRYVGALEGNTDNHSWNTYLAARYEPYSRIYDMYTGKDIWISPVYHMARIVPQMDALYDIWAAPAGFNRATISDIKELRYSCNKGQRDLFYMAQVNPIVHFPQGMTVWGQLTTQKKASSLSDLNVVRTVLYIKRALEEYCTNFIFENNNTTTHNQISSEINAFLGSIAAKGGLRSYAVEVGATEYEYKTKVCHVNVTLDVQKCLEKIQLNMYIA